MDARLIKRPVVQLLTSRARFLPTTSPLNIASRRQESSFRRSKQRLNIKPHSSFLGSPESSQLDHIIFNPPAAAPSVYHTPVKFLPKEDKRRQVLVAAVSRLSELSSKLPPPIQKQNVPNNHLTDKEINEIQELKRRQPDVWTNYKLARKFNCTNTFVSACLKYCGVDDTARKAEMKAQLEAVKARWGPRRRKAREEAAKRYQLAFRGD